jgi:hypothetical protein
LFEFWEQRVEQRPLLVVLRLALACVPQVAPDADVKLMRCTVSRPFLFRDATDELSEERPDAVNVCVEEFSG